MSASTNTPESLNHSASDSPTPIRGLRIPYMTRRATHSSRAITTVLLALLLLAGVVFLLMELIADLMGYKAVVISPSEMANQLSTLPDRIIYPWLAVGGIVVALLGIWLIFKAILPGSLNRHQMTSPRAAVIMDDSVLASAVSNHIRQIGSFGEGQVTTSVDRKTLDVQIVPNPGREIDEGNLNRQLNAFVQELNVAPSLRCRVRVLRSEAE